LASDILSIASRIKTGVGTLRAILQSDAVDIDKASLANKSVVASVNVLQARLIAYRECVTALEEAVGTASRDDISYRRREKWLEVARSVTQVADDIGWEHAKADAKLWLDSLRVALIALRGEIIESARASFSNRITHVWGLLRSDSGATFSKLFIPEARGKGYKLEFELKATIEDPTQVAEVDALRVFSESQVNTLGIAAYLTRAECLGHKLLIFDDPVQSMDEEHFRSFANTVLSHCINNGNQVVVFTHSATFARNISEHHYSRESYVTRECRSGRRNGCEVSDGNQRTSERLDTAVRLAKDGNLQEAWRFVRLAIERLYALCLLKADPNVRFESTRNLTAEDMWNKGAGMQIEKAHPGSTSTMKQIVQSTAAGAHDVPATSQTEILAAVKFIRGLLSPLGLGSG
jgi:hypothetical protein